MKIKLRDGKEREIQHMISTSFWSADGKPLSIEEFMNGLFGVLPEFFGSEQELRTIWSDPVSRKGLLDKLATAGYERNDLEELQKVVDAEQCDLLDVLAYISFLTEKKTRIERVAETKDQILEGLGETQKEFLEFVLSKYQDRGVEELDEDKLPVLLNMKYHAIADAEQALGDVSAIRSTFFDFQKILYGTTDKV